MLTRHYIGEGSVFGVIYSVDSAFEAGYHGGGVLKYFEVPRTSLVGSEDEAAVVVGNNGHLHVVAEYALEVFVEFHSHFER